VRIFNAFLISALVFTVGYGQAKKPAPDSKLFDASRLLRDIQTLSADEMEGRSPRRPSIKKSREFIELRFQESGIVPIGNSYRQEFTIKNKVSPQPYLGVNFVGQIIGRKSDRHIVVTAHYDHVGIKDGAIYNGADDNASGTAALFAIASYFKSHQPEHTIIFVALDAEELGLLGSRHFVANLPVKKESIALNVNMDMISRSDKGELYAAGTFHYPKIRSPLETAKKKARVKLLLGHDDPKLGPGDWTFQSDHAAFHAEKIPFIYFGVEDHKDYHKPTDDFENINPPFYVGAVETIIGFITIVDKSLQK